MSQSLRQRVLKGGVYLMTRRLVSLVLGLAGLTLLTRVVGPGAQGLFASAVGIVTYLTSLGLMGINVYLIREKRDAPIELFHLAFWWLLFAGIGLCVVGGGVILLAGHYWIRTEGFIPVALTLCATVPFTLLSYVPLALLERELDYRITTRVEVASQLSYYAVGIAMAWLGYGVWSLVTGYVVSQLILPLGFFGATRYRPRWYWNRAALREMLSYSFTQALAGWVYKITNLTPSMILLPFAGKEAVGYLAIANRFMEVVTFAKGPAGRLSIPAFARVQDDLGRLTRAVSEAMRLQTLALGLPFLLFSLAAPWGLPLLLGQRWDTEILLTTFAILATRVTLSALFAIQGSALYVKKHNMLMLWTNIVYGVVFLAMVYPLVALLPQEYKLYAYVSADLIAHLPTYWYKHWGMRRYIGRPAYGITALWTGATLCVLFAPITSAWLYGLATVLMLNPWSLRELRALLRSIRGSAAAAQP
ncbi:MAG: oligosaccharide flippase family protein [Candidatus Caldarchaeum sp.]